LLASTPAACRYAENQALLGSADQLVAQQADLIRQLEGRLAAAEGAAGRSQAARIGELQQQVAALQVGSWRLLRMLVWCCTASSEMLCKTGSAAACKHSAATC
jgi:hypothetical protein